MHASKNILILANSIRAKNRCIAGKELIPTSSGKYTIGSWIRITDPTTPDGAVADESALCPGHGFPRVFDILRIPLRAKCGFEEHPEDWWLEPGKKWEFVKHGNSGMLPQLADHPTALWNEGNESDSVPAGHVHRMGKKAATLYLIKAPRQWTFTYWKEWNQVAGKDTKRRRLSFKFAGTDHDFSVTDPIFTLRYRVYDKITDQPQTLIVPRPEDAYFCLSLTKEMNRRHYKICATILEA